MDGCTIKELSEMRHVSKDVAWRIIREAGIPVTRCGWTIVIPPSSFCAAVTAIESRRRRGQRRNAEGTTDG